MNFEDVMSWRQKDRLLSSSSDILGMEMRKLPRTIEARQDGVKGDTAEGVKDPPYLQSTLPGLVQGCWCRRLTFLFYRLESEWELRPSPQPFGDDSYNP